MGNIELTLESHINSLTQSNMFGIKMSDDATTATLKRISKNFYYRYSADLGRISLCIWNDFKDRKNCHAVLLVALDLEMEWREKNPVRALMKILPNPYAFEPVSLSEIKTLPFPLEVELKNNLKCLSEVERRKTPYWRAVNTAVVQLYGGECQVRVNDIPCGSTKNCNAEYVVVDPAVGTEHRQYATMLTLVCGDCRVRNELVGANVEKWGKVQVLQRYGNK